MYIKRERLQRATSYESRHGRSPKKGSVGAIEVAISRCQEPESGMLADIDRGSNPRSGFSLARGNGACAPWTLSRGRVAERRGDGVKHSTTPDDQGVTAFTVHEAVSVFLYCWAVDFRGSGGLVPVKKKRREPDLESIHIPCVPVRS